MTNFLSRFNILLLAFIAAAGCTDDLLEDDGLNDEPEAIIKPVPKKEEPLAFIGAEGFGKDATGGRAGTILFVTNLNDSGPGSLRAAIETSGPRIILFKVSGNIELVSPLKINNGDLTIAGQSAPGDGICVQNYPVTLAASNIIIRFMRFRLGDLYKQQADALSGRYQRDIIIDHCSMSWSLDEAASFYANQNFTLQWSIIAESLHDSYHDKGPHGYGAIWGGDKASFHHNLLAHHTNRNPRFNGGGRSGIDNGVYLNEHVDFRNNVIYNWRNNSVYGGENGSYNMVNNYYKPGPATSLSKSSRIVQISKSDDPDYSPGHGKFYISGNYVENNPSVTNDNWDGGVHFDSGVTQEMAMLTSPIETDPILLHPTARAFELITRFSGASYSRDQIDIRIASEVLNNSITYYGSKTGYPGIVDSQTDVGGWPELISTDPEPDTDQDGMPDEWEIDNLLDPNLSNANGRDLSTAYDNIEVYLHSIVATIITEQSK